MLIVFTGLYSLPVLPQVKNLRNFGLLKVVLVALVWAGTTVVLPILSAEESVQWDVRIEVIQRTLLVFILLIPFEKRDLEYDRAELQTLPQRFGVANSKIVGAICAVVFFFLTFLKDHLSPKEAIAKGVLFIVLGLLMYRTSRSQSNYFSSFWVEAIPIAWYLLIWILYQYT